MEISKNLESLSNSFKKVNYQLYIVGGFVRDSLLGFNPTDIDISSNAPIEVVLEICNKQTLSARLLTRPWGLCKFLREVILLSTQDLEWIVMARDTLPRVSPLLTIL